MKMQYILYNDSNDSRMKIEVAGTSLDECEGAALSTPGINRIAWARLVDGDIESVKNHAKVVSDNER